MKLLITSPAFGAPHMEPLIDFAKKFADEVVTNPYGRTMTVEELKAIWGGVDAIVAGLEPYTPEVLAQAPETLKAICRFGVGFDSVDLEAAKALHDRIEALCKPFVNFQAVNALTQKTIEDLFT